MLPGMEKLATRPAPICPADGMHRPPAPAPQVIVSWRAGIRRVARAAEPTDTNLHYPAMALFNVQWLAGSSHVVRQPKLCYPQSARLPHHSLQPCRSPQNVAPRALSTLMSL